MFGPAEVPLGEKGCFAKATRNLPSEVVYRWACAPDVIRKIVSAKPMSLRIPVFYYNCNLAFGFTPPDNLKLAHGQKSLKATLDTGEALLAVVLACIFGAC